MILFSGLTALLSGLDLWCKSWVEKNIKKGEEKTVCKDKIAVRNVQNKGMAMGVGSDKPEVIRVISIIVCGILFITSLLVWEREDSKTTKTGMVFSLAGAISNTYDRLKRKYVVDYFGFKTKSEKFSKVTFNLGDIFLIIGSVCCIIGTLKHKK